jgi:hypothetical protein
MMPGVKTNNGRLMGGRLTEFMTEILRIDDGRKKIIRRVDVLPNKTSANAPLQHSAFKKLYHRAPRKWMLQPNLAPRNETLEDSKTHEMKHDRCRIGLIRTWNRSGTSRRKQEEFCPADLALVKPLALELVLDSLKGGQVTADG